jgi:hypothetical protein
MLLLLQRSLIKLVFYFMNGLVRISIFFIILGVCHQSFAQIKDAVKNDQSYLITKFPYSKTLKFEEIYCKKFPEIFDCKNLESSDKGMFPDKFNLADPFFVKLWLRPVSQVNYDALNIAGLYLREKRPKVGDKQYEYTFLDIELDTLTNWIYAHNSQLTASHPEEVKFKLAYLELLKENLFLVDENTYSNELTASNDFKGEYYVASREFVIFQLNKMLKMEMNTVVIKEIEKIIKSIPANRRNSKKQ